MNEKARKYIDLFRKVKIATAATVDEEEHNGFEITENCIGCGSCAAACPQKCITEGQPYTIAWNHCLQCGLCAKVCPADAVKRLHK